MEEAQKDEGLGGTGKEPPTRKPGGKNLGKILKREMVERGGGGS